MKVFTKPDENHYDYNHGPVFPTNQPLLNPASSNPKVFNKGLKTFKQDMYNNYQTLEDPTVMGKSRSASRPIDLYESRNNQRNMEETI